MKRARNKRRVKLKNIKSLRRKLDLAFSLWIRKRDADENGFGKCISCGEWRPLQCGHFQKRGHLALRWHPLGAAGQCVRCNHYLGGNEAAFALELIRRHGEGAVNSLMALKHQTVKFTRADLEALIQKYT